MSSKTGVSTLYSIDQIQLTSLFLYTSQAKNGYYILNR